MTQCKRLCSVHPLTKGLLNQAVDSQTDGEGLPHPSVVIVIIVEETMSPVLSRAFHMTGEQPFTRSPVEFRT